MRCIRLQRTRLEPQVFSIRNPATAPTNNVPTNVNIASTSSNRNSSNNYVPHLQLLPMPL